MDIKNKTVFMRGAIPFEHQGNEMKRDFDGETIACNLGKIAHGYFLSEKQQKHIDGQSLDYFYQVYSPGRCATNWKAFYSLEELQLWCEAYGCKITTDVVAGKMFEIQLPDSIEAYKPLHAQLRYSEYHFQIFRRISLEDKAEIEKWINWRINPVLYPAG